MSDASPGPGWWRASNGKWYPPREGDEPPAVGWWRASDGKWYPPRPDGAPPAPGWWLASNGRWYPPKDGEDRAGPAAAPEVAAPEADDDAGDQRPAEPAPTKVVKKVAVKKVVKKVAAKKATSPAAKKDIDARAAAATAAKPAAKKAAAKKAPAKKAPSKAVAPHVVRRQDLDDEPAPTATGAASPEDQIARRNQTSAQDAKLLAGARSKAAQRAVVNLQAMIQEEMKAAGGTSAPAEAARPDPAPASPPPAPSSGSGPAASKVATQKAKQHAEAVTIHRGPEDAPDGETPLMEVKPSPMATDLERIGERLVIFEDRVELHDRNGKVRTSIRGEHIADVVIAKRFTGSVLTVESGDGTTIQAKGLRPDQADEIRELVMRRTRRKGPAPSRPSESTGPASGPAEPAPAPPAAADPAELNAMLDALHRAGVLTDAELADKRALVARLRRAERLAASPT